MYQKTIKLDNEKKVFSYIFNKSNNFTILEISSALDITFPTVKRVLDIFFKENIIKKKEKVGSSVGRKSLSYSYNENCYYSIGVKISCKEVVIVLSNTKGSILKRESFSLDTITSFSFDLLSQKLTKFISAIDNNISNFILGIGISIPGIVISEKGLIEVTEGFTFPIEELDFIKERTGLPILIENESNLSSITEVFLNQFYKSDSLTVVTINESIGSSSIFIGEGVNSFHFKAGKINHMIISDRDNLVCKCGNIGCLGLYVGDDLLLSQFSSIFPKITKFSDIFKREYIQSEVGKKIITKYLSYLAIGLKNLIVYSNPEKIVISGAICRYKNFIEKELNSLLYSTGNFYRDKNVIMFSEFSEDSPLIGAALFPIIDILF